MLKLENITVLFDDLKALDHVNMEFMEGKITGIIGTNGSGKSTLMKVMTKLLKPQEGSVYLDQQLIQDKKKDLLIDKKSIWCFKIRNNNYFIPLQKMISEWLWRI